MASPRIIWQVKEDQHGRWRDFPLGLATQIEIEWQAWQKQGQDGEMVVDYVWPNSKGDVFTPYEIVFGATMVQKNVKTGNVREVRRVVA